MVINSEIIQIKPHSHRKHSILRKYLEACKRLSDKYKNFVYIDTHGGTGEVLDLERNKITNGSVLTAAKLQPSFPCYIVEINDSRFKLLKKSTDKLANVLLFYGDCNEKIDEILERIPKYKKSVFCFVDPDSLVYDSIPQLKYETIEKIANFPRSEILLNLPLTSIMRIAGFIRSNPDALSSQKMEKHITILYRTDDWKKIDPGDYKSFRKLYIEERFKQFEYKGAILIRSVTTRSPLYYLIYGSKYTLGGIIMRDIMKKEWVEILGSYSITRSLYKTDKEWLDAEYPLTLFIFEN